MDGYHFFTRLREVACKFPKRNVKTVILNALNKDGHEKADCLLQELASDGASILEFGRYLFSHWEEIRNRVVLNIPGSCTEGQVSHVLSERFSRNPMGWSQESLCKLSKLRVYRCNGGKLTGKDIKPKEMQERYLEYADRFIREQITGEYDWSIFEPELPIMDDNSVT